MIPFNKKNIQEIRNLLWSKEEQKSLRSIDTVLATFKNWNDYFLKHGCNQQVENIIKKIVFEIKLEELLK